MCLKKENANEYDKMEGSICFEGNVRDIFLFGFYLGFCMRCIFGLLLRVLENWECPKDQNVTTSSGDESNVDISPFTED